MDVEPADLARLTATLRAAGCVWAEDEARILAEDADSPRRLHAMVARRCSGVPLEHVVGSAGSRFRASARESSARQTAVVVVARA